MNDVIEHQTSQTPAYHGDQTSTTAMVLDSNTIDSIMRVAEIMASGKSTIPAHLRNNPGDCMAVVMQAMQWKMNPFAVAQKTHLVNGTLGYEAQLVNAVVSSSSLLRTRISYEWDGDWSRCSGKNDKSTNLTVTVSATLKGESEPRRLTISMAQAGVRNSPNWEHDPKQQLAYLCTKRWARLHAPDVLLGVYTPDEIEVAPRTERDVTPPAEQPPSRPATRTDALKGKLAGKAQSKPAESAAALPAPTLDMIAEQLRQAAGKADMDRIGQLITQLPDGQYDAGLQAFNERVTELKAKAQQRQGSQVQFDADGFAQRIAACTDIDTLDVMAEELRDIESSGEHDRLVGLYRDRRAELAIG
ncbi:RecT family protein [Vogesella indigofera]|uniref:RecT family protein n=1 Tax=Vogesella indigofera TaxID=45465 RepID=A0A495BMF4_VOGIN|nr:RecT family recombinase [Vogesella indigofera]RKQ61203.1 RecT family protein [Vogesella indigofera]